MTRLRSRWAIVNLVLAIATPALAVETDAPTVAEELLEILRSAGTIDEAKYDKLRERAKQEETERADKAVQTAIEIANLAPVSAAKDGPEDWSIKWSNGFKVERNDFALIDMDDELEESIGGEGNGTELRRARLFSRARCMSASFSRPSMILRTQETERSTSRTCIWASMGSVRSAAC